MGTFVSIGTGRGKTSRFHTGLRRFIKAGMAAVGDPEPPHHEMEAKVKSMGSVTFDLTNSMAYQILTLMSGIQGKVEDRPKTRFKMRTRGGLLNRKYKKAFEDVRSTLSGGDDFGPQMSRSGNVMPLKLTSIVVKTAVQERWGNGGTTEMSFASIS